MIYIEDDDNVRSAQARHCDRYDDIDPDSLKSLEDCDEAMAQLDEILAQLHDKLDLATGSRVGPLRYHLRRCHNVRNEVYRRKRKFISDIKMASDTANREAKLAAKAAIKAANLEAQRQINERAAQLKAERIAASNNRNQKLFVEFKELVKQHVGEAVFLEIFAMAAKRVDEFGD